MFGKEPQVSPLALRKRLLIVESELNRAQLCEEWQRMGHGIRNLGQRAKTVAVWGSSAALLAAGVTALRRHSSAPGSAKSTWFQKVLNGVRVASAIWLAFRPRGEKEEQ
jgi:hypothetical protein